ncbi:hypothetical protein FOQG_03235 [Fusarium oxysporum f. sp. raphani 54005]|uniref:DUF7726 domain-containing protein n=3 Tax=Fusarium oxysporum TaxID=5507 RepID=X0CXP0_FUSOX|nr:hypothetical protein FOQG_03235 [Fusarium oxysporum f. sp. raphani 54005]EXM30276.1 hypothetical protein FOTG_04314 [Fusarium oxysporum f. sp. vasinfectum 25433]
MSGWSWSPRQAMLQMSQPRPNIPSKSLPSMPALNLPHPSAPNPALPVYNHQPVYNKAGPLPVSNNPAPPLVPVPGPIPNNSTSPAYYNPPPPFVPHTSGAQAPGGPPSLMNTSPMARGMPSGAPPIPAPAPVPATTTTSSRKRKSDVGPDNTQENLFPDNVPDIDSEDERLAPHDSDTCNAIRRKIRNWIDSGAQKVGEFQKTIGVSGKSYNSFMNRTGTWDGENTDTYTKAHIFFKKRELQGLPLKANKPKKAKTAASAKALEEVLDVSNVDPLPGEADGTVPIYDTCDEIRKKIRPMLAKEGMTQAAFIRALNKNLPEGKSVSPANMRYFMGRKGVRDGNTNIAFYAAYVFFEKKRIQAGKPKTQFRQKMEKAWGNKGFDIEHGANQQYTCSAGEEPVVDEFGKIDFVVTGRRR